MVVLLLPQKSFADITERKCKMNVTEIKPIEAVSAHRIRLAAESLRIQRTSCTHLPIKFVTTAPTRANIRSMSWSTFTQTRALPEPPWKGAMK